MDRMFWYHLVRRSSYFPLRATSGGKVAGDSPGYSWDAGREGPARSEHLPPGQGGQPGGWLRKSSLQETVGYAGGKLPAGVAKDWVTRRSSKQQSAE